MCPVFFTHLCYYFSILLMIIVTVSHLNLIISYWTCADLKESLEFNGNQHMVSNTDVNIAFEMPTLTSFFLFLPDSFIQKNQVVPFLWHWRFHKMYCTVCSLEVFLTVISHYIQNYVYLIIVQVFSFENWTAIIAVFTLELAKTQYAFWHKRKHLPAFTLLQPKDFYC